MPLTDAMLALLDEVDRLYGSDHIFPWPRGKELSDMSLSKVMRTMHARKVDRGEAGSLDARLDKPAVPHELRSTFRDWAAERKNYERELAELALAHNVGSKVEQAYRRGDMLERRRSLMADWGDFVQSGLEAHDNLGAADVSE